MNFFEHQDNARRSSLKLIGLFSLVVILIILAVNLVAAYAYHGIITWDQYYETAPPLIQSKLIHVINTQSI